MLNRYLRRDLFWKVCHKLFLGRRGYGRPEPKEAFDMEYKTGSWSHFYSDSELDRQKAVVDLAMKAHRHPSVLDIGCGSGRVAQLFQPYQPRIYVGVDLSSVGLELARQLKLPQVEWIEANFEQWTPTQSFDLIIFCESIGYAKDPGATLERFSKFLSPEGLFIVSHYEFELSAGYWKRMERVTTVTEALRISNKLGQNWDIKVLKPRTP